VGTVGRTLLDDVGRQDFLKTLAEACQKTGWQVYAYCLMSNHYQLEPFFVAVQVLGTPPLGGSGTDSVRTVKGPLRRLCRVNAAFRP
jgi:hypothetical protein